MPRLLERSLALHPRRLEPLTLLCKLLAQPLRPLVLLRDGKAQVLLRGVAWPYAPPRLDLGESSRRPQLVDLPGLGVWVGVRVEVGVEVGVGVRIIGRSS